MNSDKPPHQPAADKQSHKFVVVFCVLALGLAGLTLRYCSRRIMHVDENEFIAHVCDHALDKPVTPPLAQALLHTTTEAMPEPAQAWLTCIANERETCPSPASLKMDHGIFSALPQRYWVDVAIENGTVKKCNVSAAPGW